MMITNKFSRKPVEKLWGYEDWIVNNEKYCGKILSLVPGYEGSLHYHDVKHETFMCIEGEVSLEIYEYPKAKMVTHILKGSDFSAIEITPGTPHRFRALDNPAKIVEFSTHHDDEDTYRLESARMLDE